MHIAILTLFPDALRPYVASSIVGGAVRKGLVRIDLVDFRDFARDRHRTVDDRPFGGGPGMVLRPEPIFDCVEWLEARHGPFRRLALTPAGRPFVQAHAGEYAKEQRLLLLCGRYEGFDERIFAELNLEELSLGDFVLAGGELPALAVTEACVRLLPGALGHDQSAVEESFQGPTLDHPHYTRPRVWRGRTVPPQLLGGNHAAAAKWRANIAAKRTAERRPDLGRGQTTDSGF